MAYLLQTINHMDMFSKDGIVMFLILIPLEDRNERWKWLMAKLDNNDMRALYFEAYKILCNKGSSLESVGGIKP